MESTKSLVTVHVVDDDPAVCELLSRQLEALGCRVRTFARGEELLEALPTDRPSLVLMDLMLPGRTGDEWCRLLKEDPQYSELPVIIFTGADAAHEVMRSWRAGADDFLPKPVRGRQLLSKLEAIRSAGTPAPSSKADGPRLLFVDDSRFFRNVLGSALEHSGFHLLYAKTGEEALALLDKHTGGVDAVLTDLVMPGMTGLELTAQLRQRPWFDRRPVLLMSATSPTHEVSMQVLAATGHGLIEKRDLPVEAILSRVNLSLQRVSADLRAAERVPFFSVVEFRSPGDPEWLSGFSYDVSAGGIFVRSITPLEGGRDVELRVKFTHRASTQVSAGRVVWANPYRTRSSWCYPVGMGIRFTRLDAEDTDAITRLARLGGRKAA